ASRLGRPVAVALDASGNVFISDDGFKRVRRITAATGVITTVAGGGTPTDGLGDGGPATAAALVSPRGLSVVGVGNARWPAGTLFIADCYRDTNRQSPGPGRVRMVSPSGVITTVAGNGAQNTNGDTLFTGDGGPATNAAVGCADDVVVDAAGNLFIADSGNSRIRRVDARTGIITTIAGNGQFGLAGVGRARGRGSSWAPTR
ncbi:MAG: hypothetical protein M3256_09425, partial [Actinomycetota bacterium]|nr:hypothetical protein [Actinomycetota bacterium]